jgi:hypothetical protein
MLQKGVLAIRGGILGVMAIMGENTLSLSKIVVTKTEMLHLIFLGTRGHHILNSFCSFQVYCINFKLKLTYLKETRTNIYKFEHMKYICVKQIHFTKYEKLQIYFKTKVMSGVL